jgi:hypothetical protein
VPVAFATLEVSIDDHIPQLVRLSMNVDVQTLSVVLALCTVLQTLT